MKNQFIPIKSCCLVALWLLTLTGSTQAQFTYITNNGAISITSYTGADTVVTVPDTIDGYPVTSIEGGAFAFKFTLLSVTLPGGLTNIGPQAFFNSALIHITIPSPVTTIRMAAFDSTHITNIVIPAGVTQISESLFYGCNDLQNITLPLGLTTIESFAFTACYSLTNLTIPNTVTNIGAQAFSYNGLTSLFIPASVINLGETVFFSSRYLQTITVDAANPVYSSQDGVLFNKDQTTLITYPYGKTGNYRIPDGVTSIAASAFNFGSEFSIPSPNRIIVPAGVTNIGDYAFSRCRDLTTFFCLGNAPTNLGGEVFYFTDNVTVYYLPGTTGWGPTFADRPTALWNPTVPTNDGSLGVQTNQFGFNITGTANIPVVIEASTNLASAWVPLQSLRLTNGAVYFSDPQWTNHSQRFYRLGAP
jgi:hypothetical protein